jgi:hypothetical protein
MPAPANEHCCRPAQKSWFQSTESALNPIHNFEINIARTWIHGSTDLVEVLFTTPLRDSIVSSSPFWKHRFPEKSHRVILHTANGRQSRHINIHS